LANPAGRVVRQLGEARQNDLYTSRILQATQMNTPNSNKMNRSFLMNGSEQSALILVCTLAPQLATGVHSSCIRRADLCTQPILGPLSDEHTAPCAFG